MDTSPTNPCWNDGEVSTYSFTLSLPWKCACHNLSPPQHHIHICMSPLCQYNNYREIRRIFPHGNFPQISPTHQQGIQADTSSEKTPHNFSQFSPEKLRGKIRGDDLRKIPPISVWKYGGRGWLARWEVIVNCHVPLSETDWAGILRDVKFQKIIMSNLFCIWLWTMHYLQECPS